MPLPYPPLRPSSARLSDEQYAGQGGRHRSMFHGRARGDRLYAEVIGDPVAHSLSPVIHGFWLEKLGMTADYRARRVTVDEVGDYVAQAIADPLWRGCSVTMPLKRAIIPHVSLMALEREAMPVVNTVFRYEFGWPGAANTDGAGFWKSFTSGLEEADSPALWGSSFQIVGSGATALTIAAVLKGQGMTNLWFYCRNLEAGRANAGWLGIDEARVLPLDLIRPLPEAARTSQFGYAGWSVVINATPLGMAGMPEVPIDLALFPPGTRVLDCVYEPRETALVREARRYGFEAKNGLPMLVAQAAAAFWFFYLTNPPRQHDTELMQRLGA